MSWTGVITNAGQALLDQWAAGGHTLTIDRAAVGSGLTAAADMLTATNLANQQAAASIISKEAVAGGTKFKILISPAETTAYTATELGLWAHIDSNTSVLMSLHQDEAGGIAIPTRTQSPDFAFAMYIIHAINNTDLTVNIDPNAYVPNSVFSEAISTLDSTKLAKTGDAQSNTVTFESDDAADSEVTRETAWTTVAKLTSDETLKSMLKKISGMFKNVRRHEKIIGTPSDIAALSNAGTISGALSKLNTDLTDIVSGASLHDFVGKNGLYWLTSAVTDKPVPGGGLLIFRTYNAGYCAGEYVEADTGRTFSVKFANDAWVYTELAVKANVDQLSEISTLHSNAISQLNTNLSSRAKIIYKVNGSFNDITEDGIYYCTAQVTDKPVEVGGMFIFRAPDTSNGSGIYVPLYGDIWSIYNVRKTGNNLSFKKTPEIATTTITATTTATGAVEIPALLRGKILSVAYDDSHIGLVYPRDISYFTCLDANLAPLNAQSVSLFITYWS